MDIDSPSSLKRCNSAPIINDINPNATMTNSPISNSLNRFSELQCSSNQSRTRRFSAGSSLSPHANSPTSGLRLAHRVDQLKQEDLCNREVNHEREIHSAMQISQSYEDLSLNTDLLTCKSSSDKSISSDSNINNSSGSIFNSMNSINGLTKPMTSNPLLSKMIPLNLQMPASGPVMCSSPSPTRHGLGRQCYSPVMSWKCSSPSPTRKAFATRRSLSPIAMRPSSFGAFKRKFDLDDDNKEGLPAKRLATQVFSQSSFMNSTSLYSGHIPTSNLVLSGNNPSGGPTGTNNICGHMLLGRCNNQSCSPIGIEQGSLSSLGTPESLSSSDSPNFTFRPVSSPSSGSTDEPMSQQVASNDDTDKSVMMKTDA